MLYQVIVYDPKKNERTEPLLVVVCSKSSFFLCSLQAFVLREHITFHSRKLFFFFNHTCSPWPRSPENFEVLACFSTYLRLKEHVQLSQKIDIERGKHFHHLSIIPFFLGVSQILKIGNFLVTGQFSRNRDIMTEDFDLSL